jgi:hypothetical protein
MGEMKEPKTVEEWEESIDSHKKGVVIVPRDLFNSKAFRELSEKPTHVLVLLAALNQVYYGKKSKSQKDRPVILNEGKVYLPQNMSKTRRVNSNSTIANAKKRLVELGFLDVVETGSMHNASVFQISERWRKYPHGDYHPKDQKLPGRSLYSEHGLGNPDHPVNKERRRKQKSVQEMNVNAVQEMNEEKSHAIQKSNEENLIFVQ